MKGNSLFNDPYLLGLRPKGFLGKTRSLYEKKALTSSAGKTFNQSFGKKKIEV